MAFEVEDLFEDVGTPGMIAGIGAVVLAPIVIPAIAKVVKPIAKTAIKSSITLYEKSKSAIVEAGEIFEDLVAEAQAELADEEEIG